MSFTYPFCYTPIPEIIKASKELCANIASDPTLDNIFREGKMLGILMARDSEGGTTFLKAFSGLAGGMSIIDGFVPPIYDLNSPDGIYRSREAEISRLNEEIRKIESAPVSDVTEEQYSRMRELKIIRRRMSVELQNWLFEQYRVLNAHGERSSVGEIFRNRRLVPPGGTGDCAAPKLLQYAYLHHLQPLAIGEFWYGASPLREVRTHGSFYPACTGKCGPLLTYMMQGLDVEPNPLESNSATFVDSAILHQDDSILIVNKPTGMLSVPGRTSSISLLEILQSHFEDEVFSCHRLDMDTSGVMVFALNQRAKSLIETQFAVRAIHKTYVARLIPGSKPIPDKGIINLPIIVDWDDRPRQLVDYDYGKKAVTEYEVIKRWTNGDTDIRFFPLTGRTHQLRVHSAHPRGLGHPIKGDRLYGGDCGANAGRLHLHAESITLRHPDTGEEMTFNSPIPFIDEE